MVHFVYLSWAFLYLSNKTLFNMKEITFNIQGTEITLQETDVVADALANDDEFTMFYFERAVREGRLASFGVFPQSLENLSVVRIAQTLESENGTTEVSVEELSEPSSATNCEIWSNKGKPSEEDILATTKLLEIRGSNKYKQLFNDKKNPKNKLWKNVAMVMTENGFAVTAVKCQQKYLNLVKSYTNHVRHLHQTGEGKKVPPPFYEEMHSIIGSKDKITLANRVDTLEMPKDLEPDVNQPSTSKDSSKTYSNTQYNLQDDKQSENDKTYQKVSKRKTCVTKADVLSTIVNCNNQVIENQNKSFDKMFTFLNEQNKLIAHQNTQRDQLINILQQSLQQTSKTSKKRRRSSSSSS
ncbi:unnamed protein product [Psylliodes chrysocephalus]|uniref:Myb/SANT-like DNA-binding domain-containing protein n=1 Tax=Psylliodes chrysocephalus TaxID=3402493 RepID=A0A9P0CPP1_9CUCU|nr:unnamed protein product [Psylliodes chrysocephala]